MDEAQQLAAAVARVRAELSHAHAMLDETRDALAVTDARGVVRAVNARFTALLGVSPDLMLRRSLVCFVSRCDRAHFRAVLDAAWGTPAERVVHLRPRGGGTPFAAECRARLLSAGDVVWTVRPLHDPLGDEEDGGIARRALRDLTRVAARLAMNGGTADVTARSDGDGAVVMTLDNASIRLRLAANDGE